MLANQLKSMLSKRLRSFALAGETRPAVTKGGSEVSFAPLRLRSHRSAAIKVLALWQFIERLETEKFKESPRCPIQRSPGTFVRPFNGQ